MSFIITNFLDNHYYIIIKIHKKKKKNAVDFSIFMYLLCEIGFLQAHTFNSFAESSGSKGCDPCEVGFLMNL